MAIRYSSVNFDNGGLSTVGFALYNFDGTVKSARVATNVVEVGTSTGIYSTSFDVDDGWDGMVLWDDGEATPTYAQDEKFQTVNKVTETNDKIRIIMNTLKNRADFEGEVLMKIKSVYDSVGEMKDPTSIMQEMFLGYEGEKVSNKDDFDKITNGLDSVNGKTNDVIKALNSLSSKKIVFPSNKGMIKSMDKVTKALSLNQRKSKVNMNNMTDKLSKQVQTVVSSGYGEKLSMMLQGIEQLKTDYSSGFKTLLEQLKGSISQLDVSNSDKKNIQAQLKNFLELLNTLTSLNSSKMTQNSMPMSDELLRLIPLLKRRGK